MLFAYGLLAAGVGALAANVMQDDALGALVDAGSYGRVVGTPAGVESLSALLGDTLDSAAKGGGVTLERRSLPDPGSLTEEGARIVVVGPAADLAEVAQHEHHWHERLADGAAVTVVIADRQAREDPLWVLCGHGLPSMGPVDDCAPKDLWTTWLRVAGSKAQPGDEGRFLLEEIPPGLDPEGARAVTERLRQLYGD